jgi:uncharacterized protein GlcG (DUF336 family)
MRNDTNKIHADASRARPARFSSGLRGPAVACLVLAATLTACTGGGSTEGAKQQPDRVSALAVADVQQIIAQAVQEANARSARATIAVIDRVGNVLGVFQMNGAAPTFAIDGKRGGVGGLEGVDGVLPSTLAVISKAQTAAYFSSNGNAFTTRTAAQIIQEHFNPGELYVPAGPLFGVQISQLTCGDVSRQLGEVGPKRAPLGFAGDPGGLPLYKNGNVVGAIGVLADGQYSVDGDISDVDTDVDELIAVAGTAGFAAPTDIRADRITADGKTLRFTDSETLASNPASAPSFGTINGTQGALVNVNGYGGSPIIAGVAYGSAASGIVPAPAGQFGQADAFILVDNTGANRYPPRAGTDGLLTANEVRQLLESSLLVANRTRAQVRRPVGSTAQVSSVVVDTNGAILGFVRSPDGLVDAVDVVVQKARTAQFFSNPNAAAQLLGRPAAQYVGPGGAPAGTSSIAAYVTGSRTFFNDPAIYANGIAFSTRAIASISAPFFPNGIDGTGPGPISKPSAEWSIFNTGLELDLVYNQLIRTLVADDRTRGVCTGIPSIPNGITLFGGGFPIYRGNQLVGAIGVSGDGTDQSDLIAFVGIRDAGRVLNNSIGNAPAAIRADNLVPDGTGTRLRYALCPQDPFIDNNEQAVCSGL